MIDLSDIKAIERRIESNADLIVALNLENTALKVALETQSKEGEKDVKRN